MCAAKENNQVSLNILMHLFKVTGMVKKIYSAIFYNKATHQMCFNGSLHLLELSGVKVLFAINDIYVFIVLYNKVEKDLTGQQQTW